MDENQPGAKANFDFDRMTVERFRTTFPRARWDDVEKAWFVPGKTAERRIARWRALEQTKADIHADDKGRDAFAFDPIESSYLEPGSELTVRTPFSRTVVAELQQVPYARWDDIRRAWVVPYRSYDDLKRRWPEIEAAAKRNEPAERKARQQAAKGTPEYAAAQSRAAERRRPRYPIPVDDPPPLDRPVSTSALGIVTFSGSTGDLVEDFLEATYDDIARGRDRVWATWRTPTLQKLVETWPARTGPTDVGCRTDGGSRRSRNSWTRAGRRGRVSGGGPMSNREPPLKTPDGRYIVVRGIRANALGHTIPAT